MFKVVAFGSGVSFFVDIRVSGSGFRGMRFMMEARKMRDSSSRPRASVPHFRA